MIDTGNMILIYSDDQKQDGSRYKIQISVN